jgi:hypothetical protein
LFDLVSNIFASPAIALHFSPLLACVTPLNHSSYLNCIPSADNISSRWTLDQRWRLTAFSDGSRAKQAIAWHI